MRTIILAALVGAMVQGGLWLAAHTTLIAPDALERLQSLSYNVGVPADAAVDEVAPDVLARIDRELTAISAVTQQIRLYASTGPLAAVPEIARKHGLRVHLGLWLDKDAERNAREVEAAVRLANRHPNVRAVVVGNETLLRQDLTEDQLIGYLREVRRRVRVPVTTGETWDSWLAHPRLAREVGFLTVHILPYWEGIQAADSVRIAFERVEEVRAAFPGKRVYVGEFGWPSSGYNLHAAEPDPLSQADVLRRFVVEAAARGVEYNIVEATDQTWKTNEGSVGPYWGIFDRDAVAKFPLAGEVSERGDLLIALLGLLIGAALTVGLLRWRRVRFLQALVFALAANALGACVALVAFFPQQVYLNLGTALMWAVGFLMMVPLVLMILAKVYELAEVLLGHAPKRLIVRGHDAPARAGAPMVSVHVPAHRERPEVVIATLDALAGLDYPTFEVLVIVNNTPDERLWRPVEVRCRELGPRFKFLNFQDVAGFKAGAMNAALPFAAPEAEFFAVIDADYTVASDWLKDLVPYFDDPQIAAVQAPQDHRDAGDSVLKTIMNAEYAGFFDIGMIQRNEYDAIIYHGTMLLLRRSAFESVGGWGADTIVEDTELGLRLFEGGYGALYTNHRYGHGLLPDTFQAFKTQRQRWAYGSMQILRKHWRHLLPAAGTLKGGQRFQYATGWSYWISDAFGLLAAVLNLAWTPAILFVGVMMPTLALTVPIFTAFAVHVLHCWLLYRKRVRLPASQIAAAAIASMSLQFTVGTAVFTALVKDNLPFRRTDKGGSAKLGARTCPVVWESVLAALLLLAACAIYGTNYDRVTEIDLFALTLLVQSVPMASAVLLWLLERAAAARLAAPPRYVTRL